MNVQGQPLLHAMHKQEEIADGLDPTPDPLPAARVDQAPHFRGDEDVCTPAELAKCLEKTDWQAQLREVGNRYSHVCFKSDYGRLSIKAEHVADALIALASGTRLQSLELELYLAAEHYATTLTQLDQTLKSLGKTCEIALNDDDLECAPVELHQLVPALTHLKITQVETSDPEDIWLPLLPAMPHLRSFIYCFSGSDVAKEEAGKLCAALTSREHPLTQLQFTSWNPQMIDCKSFFQQLKRLRVERVVLCHPRELAWKDWFSLGLESFELRTNEQELLNEIALALEGQVALPSLILRQDSEDPLELELAQFNHFLNFNHGLQHLEVDLLVDEVSQRDLLTAVFNHPDLKRVRMAFPREFEDLVKRFEEKYPDRKIERICPYASTRAELEKILAQGPRKPIASGNFSGAQ